MFTAKILFFKGDNSLKILVTGVAGQLGHDVMNELAKVGIEGIGSDLAPEYAGEQDDSPVTRMPYYSLDITDDGAVDKLIKRKSTGGSNIAQRDNVRHIASMFPVG